jgi:uncharacterized protein YifN (PemK superfamily)
MKRRPNEPVLPDDVERAIETIKNSGVGVVLNCTFGAMLDVKRRINPDGSIVPLVIENNVVVVGGD